MFPLTLPQALLDQATLGGNREALPTEEAWAGSQVGLLKEAAEMMPVCRVTRHGTLTGSDQSGSLWCLCSSWTSENPLGISTVAHISPPPFLQIPDRSQRTPFPTHKPISCCNSSPSHGSMGP